MGELKSIEMTEAEKQRHNLTIRALTGVILRSLECRIPSLRAAMGNAAFEKMLAVCFTSIDPATFLVQIYGAVPGLRRDEYADVYELLMEHCRLEGEMTEWVAAAVACACQGQNHLWQDMGLDDRDMLSMLLSEFFLPLYERNSKNMRWKKFLFRQICEKGGHHCRVPTCCACIDQDVCYGPEV